MSRTSQDIKGEMDRLRAKRIAISKQIKARTQTLDELAKRGVELQREYEVAVASEAAGKPADAVAH